MSKVVTLLYEVHSPLQLTQSTLQSKQEDTLPFSSHDLIDSANDALALPTPHHPFVFPESRPNHEIQALALSDIQSFVVQSLSTPEILAEAELGAKTVSDRVPHSIEAGRSIQIKLDLGLERHTTCEVENAITSILQGAGLEQHSRFSWRASCDVDQATDSLSDVFIELQSLDQQAKDCLRKLTVSMR